jgi:hypothetical protein
LQDLYYFINQVVISIFDFAKKRVGFKFLKPTLF